MKASIFEVKCITNLHIGTSGNAYGVIKNEVEKDAVLNTPMLPASGIKGALRDYWRQNKKEHEVEIFGTDTKERDKIKKGKCKFLNAQLIFRPMRVSFGDYAYCLVTTPDLIITMLATFNAFGIKKYRGISTETYSKKDIFSSIFEECKGDIAGIVYYPNGQIEEIEGYCVKTVGNKDTKNKEIEEIYKMLFELSEGVPIAIVKSDIFNTIDLPIVARNHLVDGKSNNLWYEEIVPHQSRFYFITIWEAGDDELYEVMKKEICKTPVSFGGNNSVGNGYCSIKEYELKKEGCNGE